MTHSDVLQIFNILNRGRRMGKRPSITPLARPYPRRTPPSATYSPRHGLRANLDRRRDRDR